MGIIPAIDISNKKCVRLKQGLKGTDKVYFEKPSDAAEFWKKQGARSLHVVDLDGAFEGKIQNIDCLREIASEGLRVQFGGGIRSVEDAALVFEAGAKKIVVGTKLLSENAFEIFKQFEGKVIAAVDCKDGKVCTEGWVKKSSVGAVEAAKLAEKLGASSVLVTDVSKDGLMRGPNIDLIQKIVRSVSIDVIASGGVRNSEDLVCLEKAGATSVIVGTALYEGKISVGGKNAF